MINEFFVIDNAENDDDLDRQWSEWNQQTHANRRRSNNDCLIKYGMTNLDRYEHFKAQFNKQPIDDVELQDHEVSGDNEDLGTNDDSIHEDTMTRQQMVAEVEKQLKKLGIKSGISKGGEWGLDDFYSGKSDTLFVCTTPENMQRQLKKNTVIIGGKLKSDNYNTIFLKSKVDAVVENELLYPEYNPSITTEEALKQGGFYDSHNVWNSIMKIPSDPKRIYRGRVECLIIKGNEVYLCKRPTDEYRLPGGSFEIKNDNLTQCYNECKEESRILIKNTKFTGITYARTYSYPADWAKDLPVQWTGQYIEVYVADYDGYYNGQINRNDRDEDMYNNGRFYNIDEIYDILRDEHKKAIDRFVRKISIKESAQQNHLYFLSENNMDGNSLNPKIPVNFLTKNGYEDNKTPRICFAPSIDKALIALSSNLKEKKLYVHIPKRGTNYKTYNPSVKEVPDVNITGETWITENVKIECIGCINVSEAIDKPYKYIYGDNKTAELYGWNWKWDKQYIHEEADSVEVIGGADHINPDEGTPNPLEAVNNEMYAAAKEWSERANIKMVLERYVLDRLEREYSEFMLQTYYHRKISNQESIRIFGFNNITHYGYLKSKLLERDKTRVDVDDIINNEDESQTTVSEHTLPSNLQKKIDIIKEELSYDYDKVIVHNMINDLWREDANLIDKAIVKKFINETIDFMDDDDSVPSLLPYYTPREMEELGVYNEDPIDNFYKTPSTQTNKDWYYLYTSTGNPGNEWYRKAADAVGSMITNPTDENKQKVLEMGWNPELPFTLDLIRETSKLTKQKMDKRYNIEVINITEALNDLDDYKEVPYITKFINQFELVSYLSGSIEMEHTTGRIFTDYDGSYAAHISLYNNDIVGIGSWYKGPELLSELIDWAIKEKKANRCYCKKADKTLRKVLESKGFIATNNDRIIIYILQEGPIISEAASSKSKEKLLPVYIVTCYTASPFGMAIQKFTNNLYTHASLGFDSTLDKLYSFNVVHSDGKRGGLSLESIGQYINDNNDADLNVSVVYLKEKDHKKLQDRLNMYLTNVEKTSYSFKNIFNIFINKAEDSSEQFSMVCSQFVDSMFKAINIDLTNKPSNLVTPGDLSVINNPKVYKVYEGKARGYNPKKAEAILHKLIGSIQPIKEYTFIKNASIGLYYAIPIFEAKELPIGFDDDGALLIKNYKTIDYNVEYSRSNKLLKSYRANKNYEAMKYELCKLWFMNEVLLKKIEVAKDKEEKDALIKSRAKIMNDFTIYLNEVNKNVSGFNFSEYYEQTPFSDTVIKISGSTLKYGAQYLKAAIKAMV